MFWDYKELHPKKNTTFHKAIRICWNLLIVCAAVFFLYAAYHLYLRGIVYYKNWKLKEDVKELFYDENNVPLSEDDETFDILAPVKAENSDTVGWLEMDNTKIDYPVLQTDDNTFYQNHNFNGEESSFGSLYLDASNVPEERPQNWVIYGKKSMLGDLYDYEDETFGMNNLTFTLYIDSSQYECDVYSVYETTPSGYDYSQTRFESSDTYLEYIKTCQERSEYDFNVKLRKKNSTVTLVCDNGDGTVFVLHAKMRNVSN